MIQSLLLAVALIPSPSSFAQDDAQPTEQSNSAEKQQAEKPAPQLVRLDKSLTKTQDDKTNGILDEKRYQEFLTKFRADLTEVMTRIKPTPQNTALHARILSRLGDSEQALAALGSAIKQDPNSPALRVAASQIHYDQKDYPAALAEANTALEIDPLNKEAQALKHFSEGRDAAVSGDVTPKTSAAEFAKFDWTIPEKNDISPKALTLIYQGITARRQGDMEGTWSNIQAAMNADPTSTNVQKIYEVMQADQVRHAETKAYIQNAAHAMNAGRGYEAITWAQKAYERTPNEDTLAVLEKVRHDSVELTSRQEAKSKRALSQEQAPKNSGPPLWPLFPAMLLSATAFTVVKSRRTVESERGDNENDRPFPGELQRFVAGSVLSGIAGAGLYLAGAYAFTAVPPLVARFMAGPGQQTVRIALSKAGAINPSSTAKAEEVTPRAEAAAAEVEQIVIKKGEVLNRVWDSTWKKGANVSGPQGQSFCRGECLPINAASAIQQRGLAGISGVTNNAQRGAVYRATEDMVVFVRRAIGGVDQEVLVPQASADKLEMVAPVSEIPPGAK